MLHHLHPWAEVPGLEPWLCHSLVPVHSWGHRVPGGCWGGVGGQELLLFKQELMSPPQLGLEIRCPAAAGGLKLVALISSLPKS